MGMNSEIVQDTRPILGIYQLNDPEGSGWTVGRGCSEIVAYGEPQIHCDTAFFRVLLHGEVIARIPAYAVCVTYAPRDEGA